MNETIIDYTGNNITDFIKNYREALQAQRDSNMKLLEQTRKAANTSIMSNANTKGIMYSNIPQRDKIRYQAETYMPARVNIQNTYQTALDKLRTNVANMYNQIKYYNEQASDLDTYGIQTQ